MIKCVCESCGEIFYRRKLVKKPYCLRCQDNIRHPKTGTNPEKFARNAEIVRMHNDGVSMIKIGKWFHISKGTVEDILNRPPKIIKRIDKDKNP